MLDLINLCDAIVVAPISMAKIEGAQSARETLSLFLDVLFPYALQNEGTTDAAVITTEGLYLNDSSQSAYDMREKLWDKADKYRRRLEAGIVRAEKDDPRVLPHAYEVKTWDTLRAEAHVLFRQLMGFLKYEAANNDVYRGKLVSDLAKLGQPERDDKIAFFNEEFVLGWLLLKGAVRLREKNPLRRHKHGQMVTCYPGPLLDSNIEAYRLLSLATGPLIEGRSIWINTVLMQDQDIAHTINQLNATSPIRRNLPRLNILQPTSLTS